MHPFRAAVQAGEHDAIAAVMAEDVTLLSPVVFAPYRDRDTVAAIVVAAGRALEDFQYEREIVDGRDAALVFKARVGDREVHGCDFVRLDEHGQIEELTVMVRPLSGAHALRDAMSVQLEVVKRELGLAA